MNQRACRLAMIAIALWFFYGDLQAAERQRQVQSRITSEADVSQKQRAKRTTQIDTALSYGQTSSVWSLAGDVRRAEGNLFAVNDILNKSYGKFEETFTMVRAGVKNIPLSYGPIESFDVALTSEAIALGVIQNPVLPELHAVGVLVGGGQLGFHGSWAPTKTYYGFGLAAGFGREKRIDAVSTDIIDSLPLRAGSVTYYGFEISGIQPLWWGPAYLEAEAFLRETVFETSTPPPTLGENTGTAFLYHRWKAKFLAGLPQQEGGASQLPGVLGIEAVAGPQPLPVNVLPRVWDYAHDMYATPELGAMFGVGAVYRGLVQNQWLLESHAGFYGGYFGIGLQAQWRSLAVNLGSWGVEHTAAYHGVGARIWSAQFTVAL